MMRGTIAVISRPGAGSRFTVRLPVPTQVGVREQPALNGRRIALSAEHQAALAPWIVAWGGQPTTVVAEADIILGEAIIPGKPTLAIRSIAQRLPDELAQAQGFVCCLTLPIRISSLSERLQQVLRPAHALAAVTVPPPEQRFQGRILIADDYPVNVTIAAALCRHFGLTVDTASNGLEALTALARTTYDLVLMDCQMPELDGLSATRQLRRREASEGLHRTTVIAVTANAFADEQAECLAAGMDARLIKPVRVQQLVAIFTRYLVAAPEAGVAVPSVPAAPSDPGFDQQSLAALRREMADTDGSILRDLLASFGQQARDQLAIITGDGALEQIAKAAHSLKGQALTLGMQGLAKRAADCEVAANQLNRQALSKAQIGLLELFQSSMAAFASALTSHD